MDSMTRQSKLKGSALWLPYEIGGFSLALAVSLCSSLYRLILRMQTWCARLHCRGFTSCLTSNMLLRFALGRFEDHTCEGKILSFYLKQAGRRDVFINGPTYEIHVNEIKLKKDCSCAAASGLRRQPLLCVLETVASCELVKPVTEDPLNQNPLYMLEFLLLSDLRGIRPSPFSAVCSASEDCCSFIVRICINQRREYNLDSSRGSSLRSSLIGCVGREA